MIDITATGDKGGTSGDEGAKRIAVTVPTTKAAKGYPSK